MKNPSRSEIENAVKKKTYDEHKAEGPQGVSCAVITVSDTRNEEDDTSGRLIINSLVENGHNADFYKIVKDEPEQIRSAIETFSKINSVQVILTNGGTGITKRDTTYDVVVSILDKEMPGFGELFRNISYQEIGTPAILTRATACVFNDTIIMTLPGSGNACRTALDKIILPEISHMVREVLR